MNFQKGERRMSGFSLKKSYDINEIVKKTSYSYNVSDSIQKLDDILYSSDGNKGNELASAVKHEFECVKRNNEATSKYDYNQGI